MSNRWHLLGLTLFVLAGLTARSAAADSDSLKKTDGQKLDELLSRQSELRNELKSQLRELRTAIDNLDKVNNRIDAVRDQILSLEARIKQVEKDVESLRALTQTGSRVSGYAGLGGGTPPAAPAPPPPPGTIRLRNLYSDEVSIFVNNQAYRLAPGESAVLANQPPGSFTYEVLGGPYGVIQARKAVALAPAETFWITVNP
jgi:TolA-binding protein